MKLRTPETPEAEKEAKEAAEAEAKEEAEAEVITEM